MTDPEKGKGVRLNEDEGQTPWHGLVCAVCGMSFRTYDAQRRICGGCFEKERHARKDEGLKILGHHASVSPISPISLACKHCGQRTPIYQSVEELQDNLKKTDDGFPACPTCGKGFFEYDKKDLEPPVVEHTPEPAPPPTTELCVTCGHCKSLVFCYAKPGWPRDENDFPICHHCHKPVFKPDLHEPEEKGCVRLDSSGIGVLYEIVEPRVELLRVTFDPENLIESAARTCYQSDSTGDDEERAEFIRSLLQKGHESVIEHAYATLRINCDRGVTHELVRHRIASYSQMSTRYCDYKDKPIQVIQPPGLNTVGIALWRTSVEHACSAYKGLRACGAKPEIARAVLPNCLRTEIVATANFREWRHIIRLRTSPKAHPQMREIAGRVWGILVKESPACFQDLMPTQFSVDAAKAVFTRGYVGAMMAKEAGDEGA